MDDLYGRTFINMIKSLIPGAREVAGEREILTRCPYCGDSKDPKNAHFYISVPTSADDISYYDCKKCPAKGLFTDEVLRKLGCNDSQSIIRLNIHNSRVLKTPKYKTLKSINIYPLRNNYIRQTEYNQYKLDYINNRIGSNFTFKDVIDLKIFLNLYDVINSNRLELTRHENIVKDLDAYFIGFISYDNSFCGMRKTTDKELYKGINKRYVNYNLINKLDDTKSHYVIPTIVDVFNPQPIRIHIAEGQFDVLGIYHNLNNCNKYQNIYIACGGKSYGQTLEFILMELGITNYEVHIYPDKDVSDYEFNSVLNKLKLIPSDIYIHRNVFENEKDFGVPKHKIKEVVRKIPEVIM